MNNRKKFQTLALLFASLFAITVSSNSLAAQASGTYKGTYTGKNVSGALAIVVGIDGSVKCDFSSDTSPPQSLMNTTAIGSATVWPASNMGPGFRIACATGNTFGQQLPNVAAVSDDTAGTQAGVSISGRWFTATDSGTFSATLANGISNGLTVGFSGLTGLWYDPNYTGSGFNLLGSTAGLIVSYYGWDKSGNRLWLISDVGPTSLTIGMIPQTEQFTLKLYQTNGGSFVSPAPPSSKKNWGTLTLQVNSCSSLTATLTGEDGSEVQQLVPLAGLASFGCSMP